MTFDGYDVCVAEVIEMAGRERERCWLNLVDTSL